MSINDLPLPPAERAAAVAGFVDAVLLVALWVLRHPEYPSTTSTPTALIDSLARRELPPVDVLGRMSDFVLTQTYWDAKRRPLTESEITVRAAADRLSRAAWATRHSEETL